MESLVLTMQRYYISSIVGFNDDLAISPVIRSARFSVAGLWCSVAAAFSGDSIMRAFLTAAVLVALCGQVEAQFPCYKSSVPVTGWVPSNDGGVVIGTVTVPIVLVANQPPGSAKAAYSGGGLGPYAVTLGGTPISPTAFSASISEHPVAPGATMTILVMNAGASSMRTVGHDAAQYEGNPPLSGVVTVNLIGASVLNRFPSTITLTPDTIAVLP